MKKILFTAIALAAFSSASLANTIADEEILNTSKEDVTKVVDIIRKLDACQKIYLSTLYNSMDQGFTEVQATAIAYGAYQVCVEL